MNNQTPQNRGRILPILLIVVMLFSMYYMFNSANTATPEDYSTIETLFREGKIAEFKLHFYSDGSGELEYRLKSDESEELGHKFDVPDVYIFLNDVKGYIDEYNDAHPSAPINYTYVTTTSIWSFVWTLLPTLLLFGGIIFLFYMMNKQGGNRIGSVTKARVRGEQDASRRVGFEDVAGADEEKEELTEIVQYLKNPSQFNSLGAKIPKGVLLVGPPGTGKTLLARAVAGEAGVPFYSISGSDFVELYVGAGAARVRDLFDKAKKTRPSIIFIDEIDAVGRKRGTGLGGGHDEREQTLNQLLVEMDGFGTNEGVVVLAATNRSDILDPALLRSGRFDREVYVGLPDVKGREEILKVHSKGKPLGPDVDLSVIAKTTPGFTGADLENLLNEAALLAAKRGRKAITEKDIEESAMKIMAGTEKKSRVVTPKECRLTAYHEAGHAIATFVMKPNDPVHQISIVPRGMMGGYTMSLPEDDKRFMTRNEMKSEIVTLLGGRVAEHLVLDDISTGASNDLERATEIARSMVTRYGFSDKLGPVVYSNNDEVFLGRDFMQSRTYSEKIATDIDTEIHSIIEGAYISCDKILKENIQALHRVANALLDSEKIDGAEFKKLMDEPQPLLNV